MIEIVFFKDKKRILFKQIMFNCMKLTEIKNYMKNNMKIDFKLTSIFGLFNSNWTISV